MFVFFVFFFIFFVFFVFLFFLIILPSFFFLLYIFRGVDGKPRAGSLHPGTKNQDATSVAERNMPHHLSSPHQPASCPSLAKLTLGALSEGAAAPLELTEPNDNPRDI